MIYFFHHYELPAILQQARIQQIIIESQNQPTDSGTFDGSDGSDGRGGSDGPPSTGDSNQNTANESDQNTGSPPQEESHPNETDTTGNDSELNASSREPSIASQVEETDSAVLMKILLQKQLGSVWNSRELSFKQKLDLAVEATVLNKKTSELNQLNTTSILLNSVQVRKAPTARV